MAEDEPWEVSWCWFEDAILLTASQKERGERGGEEGERERERLVDENRPSFWVMGQGDVFNFIFIFPHGVSSLCRRKGPLWPYGVGKIDKYIYF